MENKGSNKRESPEVGASLAGGSEKSRKARARGVWEETANMGNDTVKGQVLDFARGRGGVLLHGGWGAT